MRFISKYKRWLFAIVLLTIVGQPHVLGQEHFTRGLEQISFIPKGQWITGVSVSYEQSHQDNYQFLVVENLSGDTYTFKISPMLFYCFKDNLAVGARFGFKRNKTQLDGASIVLGYDSEYDIDNLYSLSQQYSGMLAFRNYISLGNNKRFGFFNEVQLELAGGQSKIISGLTDDLTGTFENNFSLGIGLSPGLIMFLNNYSAIEVTVGVLGFNYNHTKSTTDRIYIANRHYKQANFKINLFSISFGAVFYL